MEREKILREIFSASLKVVDPYETVKKARDVLLGAYGRGSYRKVIVAGFGKAACPMAKATEEILPVDDGMVITKYGHCEKIIKPAKISVFEGGHPVPDENGLRAAGELLKLLGHPDSDTFVVCLISGGGSALLTFPVEGVTLDEKRRVTELLLLSGADINELNTVRKHISQVKGGRLARIIQPAGTVSLVLSDVVGDKLDIIASGPTAPDPSTYEDALDVIEKYRLPERIPQSVLDVLKRGRGGQIPETPKEGDRAFENVHNIIVGSNRIALEAAKQTAESCGFRADIISSALTGEARKAGRWLVEKALKARDTLRVTGRGKRICYISGGETTVTVKGKGRGGRNTELALSAAIALDGEDGITLLSAGTDGTDGPTDAAGAMVDGESVKKARALGLNSEAFLNNNDSYTLFKETGDIFTTGPTGTNVMDIQIALIE
jgi:glycerate-2-kinase